MNVWDQEKYIKAWNYACVLHNGQFVPGTDIPYINHIGLVAMEAMAAIVHENIHNPDLLVLCGLLHDTIEDTNATYENIQNKFGREVADGVLALTKNKKMPSKEEQMTDSIARIKLQPKEIWMVKLSDRITNLQPPPKHWNSHKIGRYMREAKMILKHLGEASPYLSKRMEIKIDKYAVPCHY